MPIGDDQLPVAVIGWRDREGRVRRVVADYPNGWRLSFGLTEKNVVTRVSGRIRLVVQSGTLGETR